MQVSRQDIKVKCTNCDCDLFLYSIPEDLWETTKQGKYVCEDCYEGVIEEELNNYGEPMSEFEKEFGFDINDEAGYRD